VARVVLFEADAEQASHSLQTRFNLPLRAGITLQLLALFTDLVGQVLCLLDLEHIYLALELLVQLLQLQVAFRQLVFGHVTGRHELHVPLRVPRQHNFARLECRQRLAQVGLRPLLLLDLFFSFEVLNLLLLFLRVLADATQIRLQIDWLY